MSSLARMNKMENEGAVAVVNDTMEMRESMGVE